MQNISSEINIIQVFDKMQPFFWKSCRFVIKIMFISRSNQFCTVDETSEIL